LARLFRLSEPELAEGLSIRPVCDDLLLLWLAVSRFTPTGSWELRSAVLSVRITGGGLGGSVGSGRSMPLRAVGPLESRSRGWEVRLRS
jgi:hypothetical protein